MFSGGASKETDIEGLVDGRARKHDMRSFWGWQVGRRFSETRPWAFSMNQILTMQLQSPTFWSTRLVSLP